MQASWHLAAVLPCLWTILSYQPKVGLSRVMGGGLHTPLGPLQLRHKPRDTVS